MKISSNGTGPGRPGERPPRCLGGRVRWKVQIRSGREYVTGRTFDTEREAVRWETAEKAKLSDGYSPALGRVRVGDYLAEWIAWRSPRVQSRTLTADRQMVRHLPMWLLKLELRAVTPGHVERWQDVLTRDGLARTSVARHRQALSGLFARAVAEGRLSSNPVSRAEAPPGRPEPVEVHPMSSKEVREIAAAIRADDERLADVVLVLFWTGLRWSEARALTVADFVRGPVPVLRVRRAQPEGGPVKVTKSGKGRSVPLPRRAVEVLERAAEGKNPDDLLLTTVGGAQLHRTAFIRSTGWARHSRGRRIHDLRHSAICWWLSSGLPLHTVKAMAGHASITTTERYLHFVGDAAARTVIDRLNDAGSTTGAPRQREGSDDD